MFGQNRPLTCALALLLASLAVASQAEAGSFKDLFSKGEIDESYVKLADELYKATPSSELKDNVAAADQLYRTIGRENVTPTYDKLLAHFSLIENRKYLRDRDRRHIVPDKELCDDYSMETLRIFAEFMLAQGNLAPKKITEPIRRLNRIIIRQILKARTVCFGYQAGQWPAEWQYPEKDPFGTYKSLGALDDLPRSLLLDSQPNLKSKELQPLGVFLKRGCYIYEGVRPIKPYLDLLMASHIIDPESKKLAKFYQDPSERAVVEQALKNEIIDPRPDEEILKNVYRSRACELLAKRQETLKN